MLKVISSKREYHLLISYTRNSMQETESRPILTYPIVLNLPRDLVNQKFQVRPLLVTLRNQSLFIKVTIFLKVYK